jgi:hypothetical protein
MSVKTEISPSNIVDTTPSNLSAPVGVYPAVLPLEENLIYAPQAVGDEHWFWKKLVAPQNYSVIAKLSSTASGTGEIALTVWGSTESTANPDHHLRVAINGTEVVDQFWDGTGRELITGTIPAVVLRDGRIQVTIETPGDTQSIADVVYLDWIEIKYPRYPVAENDRLFIFGTGDRLRLSDFSGAVQVFDVTQPDRVIRVQEELEQAEGFVTEVGKHYLAIGPKGTFQPKQVSAAPNQPDLRLSNWVASYIAIGKPELLKPLQPLLDLRSDQGLSPVAIDIEAIYDQFNYGLAEPIAIQRFMQFATENWNTPPRYLLLVGDSSYDPKGYLANPDANQIPAFLVNTEYGGETSGDIDFVQVNQDSWPDVAIGHIPARNAAHVNTLVDKILNYEMNLPAADQYQSLMAIADSQDPSFQADAQEFLNYFSGPDYSTTMYAPPADTPDANVTITNYLKANNWLVAYFGHGSLNMWGKDRLFTSADVNQLDQQESLPVILNFTCLTGLYTHPEVESLAETFLWQPRGGAVAVLAPSSLTLPTDQSLLSNVLAKLLAENPQKTLGEIHLLARRQVPIDSQGMRDVLQTFMLFGDPALRLGVKEP